MARPRASRARTRLIPPLGRREWTGQTIGAAAPKPLSSACCCEVPCPTAMTDPRSNPAATSCAARSTRWPLGPRRGAPPRRKRRPPSASSPRSKRASPTSTRGASRLDDLRVASPCPASWDAMVGDDRVRFCGQCQKSVYDIKALTPGGLRSLHGTRRVLAASGGPGVEAVRPLGCLAAPTRTAKFRGSSARTRMPSWGPRWVGSCTPPAFSVG